MILILDNMEEHPWTSFTWQSLTKFLATPWKMPNDAAFNTPLPHVPNWNTWIAQSIKLYVENLHSKMDQQAQIAYVACRFLNNDSTGCTAYIKQVD